jgi:cytidylate kinase
MMISITGVPGSGKSTIAEMLSRKFNLKRFYIGEMRRKMAQERGMTLEEFNALGEKDISTDREVDEYQTKLGETEDDFIIEGRTSFYFIPDSIKLFIDVDLKEGARRIFYASQEEKSKRNEKSYSSIDDVLEEIKERMASDRKRYRQYYGLENCYDRKHFDYVIDTTKLTPQQAFNKILEFINEYNAGKQNPEKDNSSKGKQ